MHIGIGSTRRKALEWLTITIFSMLLQAGHFIAQQ